MYVHSVHKDSYCTRFKNTVLIFILDNISITTIDNDAIFYLSRRQKKHGMGLNSLVIDSEEGTAGVLCDFLNSEGHRNFPATTASDVRKILNRGKIDLNFPEIAVREINSDWIIDLESAGKIIKCNVIVFTTFDDVSNNKISGPKKKGYTSFFKTPIEPSFPRLNFDLGQKIFEHNSGGHNG